MSALQNRMQMIIPQGTILGALLFLLFLKDMVNCLSNCESRIYSDDTLYY